MFGLTLKRQHSRGSHYDTLEDARRLSRFAASRGMLNEELSKAIKEVSEATAASSQQERESTEQNLLLASSSMLAKLGVSNIDQIRRYYTKRYSVFYAVTRYIVLFVMILCITLVIPLTFIFNQTTTRLTQIRDLDTLIQTEGIYSAGRSARLFPQAGEKHPPEVPQNASVADREASLARLQLRVEFLIHPPRMMDMVQVTVNSIYTKYFSSNQETFACGGKPWIVTMLYYRRWYCNGSEMDKETLFDVSDASAVTEQLQRADSDFVFVSYILGSGILPVLYGALGSSVFLSRKYLFSTAEIFTMSNPIAEVFVRIGLGAVAGVAVGWLQFPKAAEQFTSTPLAIAFAAGFSIDIAFSFLERLISTFDFRKESSPKAN